MANPQKENGHIDIANEIAEVFARYRLSGSEWQVLWVILRNTWGWHKKDEYISYGVIAEKTGLGRTNVIRAVQSLVGKNILVKNGFKMVNNLKFNKDYENWEGSLKNETINSIKSDTTGSLKNDTSAGIKIDTTAGLKNDTTIDKRKEKRNNPPVILKSNITIPPYVDSDVWNAFVEMRKKIKAPLTDNAKKLIFIDLEKYRDLGDDPNDVLKKSIKNSWRGVFPLKEEDKKGKKQVRINEDTEFICGRCKGVKQKSEREYTEEGAQVCKQCFELIRKQAMDESEKEDQRYRQKWAGMTEAKKQKHLAWLQKLNIQVPEWMGKEGG